jgi:hypothetical protein
MDRSKVGREAGEGAGNGEPSMMVDGLMEKIEVLLKHMEETWGDNPSPELEQCTLLACRVAAKVFSTVEDGEGKLGKLELAVAVVKMHVIEVFQVR